MRSKLCLSGKYSLQRWYNSYRICKIPILDTTKLISFIKFYHRHFSFHGIRINHFVNPAVTRKITKGSVSNSVTLNLIYMPATITKSHKNFISSIVGHFNKHGLTLIPAWISKYTHYEVWDKITYPFVNFNGATVEVWERISNFILHLTGHVITYPCWD